MANLLVSGIFFLAKNRKYTYQCSPSHQIHPDSLHLHHISRYQGCNSHHHTATGLEGILKSGLQTYRARDIVGVQTGSSPSQGLDELLYLSKMSYPVLDQQFQFQFNNLEAQVQKKEKKRKCRSNISQQ